MSEDWHDIYGEAIRRLPSLAATAPLTFCGYGTCVDARVSLHDIQPMLTADQSPARALAALLQGRAARGEGGEITFDWPEGSSWIKNHLQVSYAIGGTSPHAAWTLSAAGAPAVLALQDRSEFLLRVVPSDVLLAEGGVLRRSADVQRSGEARPPVFIFEYTAGYSVGDVTPARSSRIIVKFAHFKLEDDPEFNRVTEEWAGTAGAGLISGFSSVAAPDIPGEAARIAHLARGWRDGGLSTIHFEIGGYDTFESMNFVLNELRGLVTSIGMSQSELRTIMGDSPLFKSMQAFGERLGVDRVCVHADNWAASLTKRDPKVERNALVMGCLLAASRAAAGMPVRPVRLDPKAVFEPLPFAEEKEQGTWRFVACSAPYLRSPKTTLGLGDTFTAGCLLELGAVSVREGAHSLPKLFEGELHQVKRHGQATGYDTEAGER